MKDPRAWAVTVLLLSMTGPADAAQWEGKVLEIIEGDLVVVQRGRARVTVRLHGVDTPEMSQPFGPQARRFTRKMVAGKRIRIKVIREEKTSLVIGEVFVETENDPLTGWLRPVSLNESLVASGLAWGKRTKKLQRLQAAARKARRGIWASDNPVHPEQWRKGIREGVRVQGGRARVPRGDNLAGSALSPGKCARDCVETRRKKAPTSKKLKAECRRHCAAQEATPAQGYLVANTTPPARILIDGKDTGRRTPLTRKDKIALPPGSHVVTFVVGSRRHRSSITIKSGQITKIIKDLSPAPSPPRLPWSKDRVCKVHRDCVLHERHICAPCPATNPAWRNPVSKATLERWRQTWAIIKCKVEVCPGTRWLGGRAVCAGGQCAVRP